ncbi:cupin domain-containing protein [Desulfocurvus sp. DL9XJH121]
MRNEKVNIEEKFSLFDDLWHPRIVAQVNDTHVKLGRIKGSFEWHSHAREEEMFLVVSGKMVLRFRDRDVELGPGELMGGS